ncbi:unnamed protein product [Coccothraustes coccothraustes]
MAEALLLSHSPAASAGFVLLRECLCLLLSPALVQTVSSDPLSALRAGWCCRSTCSRGTELTPSGKGRTFCPLPPADGLGTAGGHTQEPRVGAGLEGPICPSPVPRLPPVQEGCGGVRRAVRSGLCCRPGELAGIIRSERHKLCRVLGLSHRRC